MQNVPGPAFHPYRPPPAEMPAGIAASSHHMPARPRELLGALALVAVADLAIFADGELGLRGIPLAIFFAATPIFVLAASRVRRVGLRAGSLGAMLAAIAVRCAYAPTAGTIALGLLSVFAFAVAIRLRGASLTDVGVSFGSTFAGFPYRILATFSGMKRSLGFARGRTLAGIAIPAALVALFVGIFALANPLVARWVGFVGHAVSLPAPARIAVWAALAFGAALLVRPAFRRSSALEDAEEEDDASDAALSVSRNVLLALNATFLFYNVLDATYLWAGAPPPGVSERVYAHQGAAWLTVALVVLTAVVGVTFRGALAHDPRARLSRILAYVWLGQGAVLALGTYRRIAIHVSVSGLSNLRILGIFGTSIVVLGVVLIGTKLVRRRTFTWLVRRQLDVLLGGALLFALTPTHLVSARFNAKRVMAHEYQSLVHVEEQASEVESAAALLPLLDHDDERIRRGMAALLLDERDALRRADAKTGWRHGDIATSRAHHALEAATTKLDAVLGDVERKDAIQQWEYIRNSAIEGEIAQSEIDKVEYAPTRSQKVVKRWIDAHDSHPWGMVESDYAALVLVSGKTMSSSDVIASKRAARLRVPPDAQPAVRDLPDGRVEARVPIESEGKRYETVLFLEKRGGEWKIVEER